MLEHHQTPETHQRLHVNTRTRVFVKEKVWGCLDTWIVSQIVNPSQMRENMKTIETKATSLFKYYK